MNNLQGISQKTHCVNGGSMSSSQIVHGLLIQQIALTEVSMLLNSNKNNIGEYKPMGLFYFKESNGCWIGIDNRTGDAWIEEFANQEDCIEWLTTENEPNRTLYKHGKQ